MKQFRESEITPKNQFYGDGWCRQLDKAWTNGTFAVMARDIETEIMGKVTHVFIRHAINKKISWAEKQEIKNKIFGPESVAIEVFPEESKLVDAVNAYHLWILHDFTLPFSLK